MIRPDDGMWRLDRRLFGGGLIASAVAACSPIGAFNAFVPADPTVGPVIRDVAFGPHPRQRLDVYQPAATGARHPVIVFIYGGAWKAGEKSSYAFVGQALAARGFVTAIPDYRLVPDVLFPEFLDDNARALAHVRRNAEAFGGDADRIMLAGHSAGAYNALMLALDPRYLRRHGLGTTVIRRVAGLSGPYSFLPLVDPDAVATFQHWPDLAETQPVTHARRSAPPAFLATGDRDLTVVPVNTEKLASRLRQAGAQVTVKVYPGLDHAGTLIALSRPFRGDAPVLDDMVRFFSV